MTLRRNDEPVLYVSDISDPLIDEGGTPNLRFYNLLQGLAARVPIYGSGSPEGRFESQKGRLYIDQDGAQGGRVYMKTTEGGAEGWEPA